MNLVLNAKPDTPSYMIAIRDNKAILVLLMAAVEQVCHIGCHILPLQWNNQTQSVMPAIKEKDFAKAISP